MANDIREYMQGVWNDFLCFIGINNLTEKKERMITDEVNMQIEDTCARSDTWFENLSDSFDAVNSLFPDLNLTFTMKYGGEKHEYNAKTNADRAL